MKVIIYRGRPSRRSNAPLESEGDAIELLSNDWDDFGFKTSFPTVCRVKGKVIELGMIRLLVDGETNSAAYLDRLRKEGWNGDFPIPDKNYVSVPAEISFYEQLMGTLRASRTVKVAKLLRDASYLVNME